MNYQQLINQLLDLLFLSFYNRHIFLAIFYWKMEKLWVLFILMVATVHSLVEGKIFTKCELVKELERSKISRSLISNWVCLIESESKMDTRLVTGPKTAASYSYGILQINSAKWCTRGRKGGICNKRCEDFLHDNIQEDIECAKIIVNQEGFKAWDGWTKKCKNKMLPDIGNCNRKRRMLVELESDPVISIWWLTTKFDFVLDQKFYYFRTKLCILTIFTSKFS